MRRLLILILMLTAFPALAELKSRSFPSSDGNLSVVSTSIQDKPVGYAVVPTKGWKLKILTPASAEIGLPKYDGLTIKDYLAISKAKAVMSGGYLAGFSPPRADGLVRISGKTISPPKISNTLDSVLCVDGSGIHIDLLAATDIARHRDCIQAGPLIVRDGVAQPVDIDRIVGGNTHYWSFACLLGNGQFAMGVSEPVRHKHLATFLTERLNCRQAVHLTGSYTAGFIDDSSGLVGWDDGLLPNALAILPDR